MATTRDPLDYMIEKYEEALRGLEARMACEAQSLGERMLALASRMRGPGDRYVNSLGEVQGDGRSIDTLCTRVAETGETLRVLRGLRADRPKTP